MSRIRSTHPGLWTDEAFVTLSPFARLMFMGIWNECDDAGSFAWSPLGLKMKLLPADNVDAAALLDEMIGAGLVMKYEIGGKSYGAVRNFCQYQRPKKPNALYPQTDSVRDFVNVNARDVRSGSEPVGNQSGSGREKPRQMEDGGDNKKEEEIIPPTPLAGGNKGKSLLPADWQLPAVADLPPKARACAERWTQANYETEGEAFILYWGRSSGRMMKDWEATWANRVIARNEAVLRSQKFGNDAPAEKQAAPTTAAECEKRAKWFDDHGMADSAADWRRKAEAMKRERETAK